MFHLGIGPILPPKPTLIIVFEFKPGLVRQLIKVSIPVQEAIHQHHYKLASLDMNRM